MEVWKLNPVKDPNRGKEAKSSETNGSMEALFYISTVFLALGTVMLSVVFRDSPRY
jgi:hypothetical protein